VTISAAPYLPATALAGHVERSRLIGEFPWVRHGITTRVSGLGVADGNVGYTSVSTPPNSCACARFMAARCGWQLRPILSAVLIPRQARRR
jgi:hypothetical protein